MNMNDSYWRLRVTLAYRGKEYSFDTDNYYEGDCYWWKEGNGGCDCNRSLFIKRNCDADFPEMKCGETIDLVKIEPLFKYKNAPELINGKWTDAVK
jgi:hypothetical protein